jgi:hypothetical protein
MKAHNYLSFEKEIIKENGFWSSNARTGIIEANLFMTQHSFRNVVCDFNDYLRGAHGHQQRRVHASI